MTHPGRATPTSSSRPGRPTRRSASSAAGSEDGKFLGCVVNFACHGTTGPGGISADYIYYVEKTIRGLMGEDAVVVFLPGMAGDVTQVDNRSPYQIKQFGEVSAVRRRPRRGRGAQVAAGDGAARGPALPVARGARSQDQRAGRPPEHVAEASSW